MYKVVAISKKGQEFLYKASSAHKVSARSAKYITDVLNAYNFQLKEGEIWHIHEIDRYDSAYMYMLMQEFRVYKGTVKEYGF